MPHTLLLADDSLAIQRVVELTFAGEDVRVIAVGDGQQAIERLLAERPDIVLADIAMPLADGYAVAEFVRATPAIRDVPVLLLAGAFDIVEESRLGASGARGVLVKPFEPHVVISRVKELLGLGPSSEAPSAPPIESARLMTPVEPPRPPRTLRADPPFWREPAAASSPELPAIAGEGAHVTQDSTGPNGAVSDAAAAVASREPVAAVPPADPSTALDADVMASLVDRIAARVVEQLGDRLRSEVTDLVLNVSERLVREEIQRIRDAAEQKDL